MKHMPGQEQQQPSEERRALADAIDRRSDEIVSRWLDQVRADAATASVPLTDLRDGIHDYLRTLAQLVRQAEPIDRTGAAAWADVAREHALTRVRLGFDVTQLVHELVLVRRVTAQVLREEGVIHAIDDYERVVELTDVAIAASIKSYVDSRDFSARRAEAEHIGFLAHELRNPLGAVTMAARQLQDPRVSEEGRRHLYEILDRNVDRLRRLIDDTLLTEKLEVAEPDVRLVDTTVGKLAGDSIGVFERSARDKGLQLRASYDPTVSIRADPALTLSALEHVLENAIKYTDEGAIDLVIEDAPDEVVFHVRDHCSGLSPEELRIIFEPFKRAHRDKQGTGLGLAIARRSVEAQGGTIHAESKSAEGCHFWFTVPKTHH